MYLEHFNFKDVPFSLTPNTKYYCHLPSHQEALNTILLSLRTKEGFIKIIGEVGSGKTLLCRKLLNFLDEEAFVTAYIPHPDLTPSGLRKALARELSIDVPAHTDQHGLITLITEKLLKLSLENKPVVLIIDEAQTIPRETLEAIRLLTNIETESMKLLQIVLFGQPELDERLQKTNLRQLNQRISFSYHLAPIARKDLNSYLCHRLSVAGYTYGALFSKKACDKLYAASGGIPRLINILCHKALMVAYGEGRQSVGPAAMKDAIKDTETAHQKGGDKLPYLLIILGTSCVFAYLMLQQFGKI